MRDFYEVLGVPRDADAATINRRFKELARRHHPDLHPDPENADLFKEITRAQHILSDPERRKLYDEFGELSLRAGFDLEEARRWKRLQEIYESDVGEDGKLRPPPPPAGHAPDDFKGFSGYGTGGQDLDQVFGDIFGGSFAEGDGFFGQKWKDEGGSGRTGPVQRPKKKKTPIPEVIRTQGHRGTHQIGGARRPGFMPDRQTSAGSRTNTQTSTTHRSTTPRAPSDTGSFQPGPNRPQPKAWEPGPSRPKARAWEPPPSAPRPSPSVEPRGAQTWDPDPPRSGIRIGERPSPARGADIQTSVGIPLLQVFTGGVLTARVQRPVTCTACKGIGRRNGQQCTACGGSGRGRVEEETEVRVPQGVRHAELLRFEGRGGRGRHGGNNGDLLVTVEILSHPLLRREGLDLYLDVPITVAESITGGPIEVPTPGGRVRVRIPAHCGNGRRLRLRARGLPGGDNTGDLYLIMRPTPPAVDAAEAARLAAQLERFYEDDVRASLIVLMGD